MAETAPPPLQALINIDVPDLAAGRAFYEAGLGFRFRRSLFDGRVAELCGAGLRVFLIESKPGAPATATGLERSYARHWTPVHLDLVVEDLEAAVARAEAAGARLEKPIRQSEVYRLAPMADPFGHGFCLMTFLGSDYDPVACG